jgi:hypothetical protein
MQKTGKGYIPIPVLGFIGLIRLQKYFHNLGTGGIWHPHKRLCLLFGKAYVK